MPANYRGNYNITFSRDSGSLGTTRTGVKVLPRKKEEDYPSPFEVRDKFEKVRRSSLADKISKLNYSWAKAFSDRIVYLNEVMQEDQPQVKMMSIISLEGVYNFLKANEEQYLNQPDAIVADNGNVRIQWTRSKAEHLVVEFLSENLVKFVIFGSDPDKPYQVARIVGTISIDGLFSAVKPYRAFDWVFSCAETH